MRNHRRFTRPPRVSPALALVALLSVLIAGCGQGGSADSGGGVAAAATARKSLALRSDPSVELPRVAVRSQRPGTARGYIFLTPSGGAGQDGLMIVDDSGQPVWHRSTGDHYASDLRVGRYKGEPVLSWWEGRHVRGWGRGEYVVVGSDYRERARLKVGRGYEGDLHEFVITDEDTALVSIYSDEKLDLRSAGGKRRGDVVDSIIQEIDIDTGKVLWQWSSLHHIGVRESYGSLPSKAGQSWDYFHLNSIDVDEDGDLIVSGRNTHALYKLDRKSGRVLWRLGGKRSDFAMGKGTRFAWQHDARRLDDGTVTLFDNEAAPKRAAESRALQLKVDERRMRVTRARQYTHPRALLSNNQANVQVLPNRDVMVGWGFHPYITEFSRAGRVLFDARFADPENTSYRAYRFKWTGEPATDPDLAVRRSGGAMTVYASWNGATEVASWRVLAGASARTVTPRLTGPRSGFETALQLAAEQPCVGVEALDASGRTLGASEVRCD